MKNKIYISGINYESMVDGDGVRAVIFVSGCSHNCKGCHNPLSHDFEYGRRVDDEFIDEINEELKKRPFLSGITFSGGDPLYSYKGVLEMIEKLYIPKDNIWLYTGFTYENIITDNFIRLYVHDDPDFKRLLERVNVIVDGLYIQELRDLTLAFRGSSNQVIHRLR